MKRFLVLRSYVLVVKVDLLMRFRSLRAIHSLVRNQRVTPRSSDRRPAVEAICRAVGLACVFYVKPVLCLQRSAATTVLLRRCGWDARLADIAKRMRCSKCGKKRCKLKVFPPKKPRGYTALPR